MVTDEELQIVDRCAKDTLAVARELLALRKDAERYRWLRDLGSTTWVPFRLQWHMGSTLCDAAIDGEMERQRAAVGAA